MRCIGHRIGVLKRFVHKKAAPRAAFVTGLAVQRNLLCGTVCREPGSEPT